MTLQKKHLYKVFTEQGVYLGLLPNVVSSFSMNQTMGSYAVQTEITVATSIDNIGKAPNQLYDEAGRPLQDENGNFLTDERQPDIVGSYNSTAQISNDNLIQVWEYSSYHPNGILMFSGYISMWKAAFGASDNIVITCISNGQDLANYIVPGENALFADQSQLTANEPLEIGPGNTFLAWAQAFTVGAGVTNIGAVTVKLGLVSGSSQVVTLALIAGTPSLAIGAAFPGGTILASQTVTVNTNTLQPYQFIFPTPVSATPGTTFTLAVIPNSSGVIDIGYSSTLYGGGISYGLNGSNNWLTDSSDTLYFETFYSTFTTTNTFPDIEVSTIMQDIMADYAAQGGLIKAATFPLTGIITTYAFKLNLMSDAIGTIVGLGPENWYAYVDPAQGELYYLPENTVADVTFIKGRHFNELDIQATKENIKNVVYFSGGSLNDGANVFVQATNATSLTNNRVGLALISDNRVSTANLGSDAAAEAVGLLIAQNYLNNNQAEQYITTITVQDKTYDISSLHLGQMVGFSGFGTFVEGLLLQIVGINYSPDQAVLQLGVLPKRTSAAVAIIEGELADLQTVANPNSPT